MGLNCNKNTLSQSSDIMTRYEVVMDKPPGIHNFIFKSSVFLPLVSVTCISIICIYYCQMVWL